MSYKSNTMKLARIVLILTFLLISGNLWATDFKVGIARKAITPDRPLWLNGYAERNEPFTGVSHDLWAKALVIEENPGSMVIIVTLDILGLNREIPDLVADRVMKKYGINRSQLFLNSSHTHSAPVIWPCLSMAFDFDNEEQKAVVEYSHKLTGAILDVIDSAMSHRVPMNLASGHGSAGVAANRRDRGIKPVDHDVQVIRVADPNGKVQAIVCGYACHNTTLTGENNLINGDYAGYAMIELEKTYPGATALFIMGCGGDIDPALRGTIALAQQNGKELAGAVEKVLGGEMNPVLPAIRTAYTSVNLEFPPLKVEKYQADIMSDNQVVQNRAKLMLEAYNKGWDVTRYPYPVQAIRFNDDLTILGMGGEVVVDYDLKMKAEYPGENLFVAGYCNQVNCYIPSKRILDEGGYETNGSLTYYGHPGPFAGNVEDLVTGALHRVMQEVGANQTN